MLSFGFRDHVAVAVSANAGTYAMPDLDIAWPFGLGETELDRGCVAIAVCVSRITVMAGTHDTKTTGRFFPKGRAPCARVATRHERAHNYVAPDARPPKRWARTAPGR